jgi:triosephosphate isomerase (TIM)
MRDQVRHRFVVGNWKLNGDLVANAALLSAIRVASAVDGKTLGVCVSSPYFGQLQQFLAETPRPALFFGSQDVSRFASGAYTGEVSAAMVKEFGAVMAIVGHSERRAIFGESDQVVAEKFGRARAAGLQPILCVGETLAEREAGTTEVVVARQLAAVISAHGIAVFAKAVVAYEPVWAIGTGKTASPDEAEAVHAFLRTFVAKHDVEIAATLPILYGGSVKKSNAAALFAMPNIDGGLIGGASLVADEFLGIWQAL